jgi:hypothetical protein
VLEGSIPAQQRLPLLALFLASPLGLIQLVGQLKKWAKTNF